MRSVTTAEENRAPNKGGRLVALLAIFVTLALGIAGSVLMKSGMVGIPALGRNGKPVLDVTGEEVLVYSQWGTWAENWLSCSLFVAAAAIPPAAYFLQPRKDRRLW